MGAIRSPDFDFPDFDENTQAATFYTSGTTGAPKGVYFSHRQMVLHAISELAAFGMAPKQGDFTPKAAICRSRRCSMSTREASRVRRRSRVRSKSIPGVMFPICC